MKSRPTTSSKQSAALAASSRMSTLHQRLYNALSLGRISKCCDEKGGQKWICTDIEIQRLVVRSIDAFLDCIYGEKVSSNHPLVKDSVGDMVGALESILESNSESMLRLATDVAAKMVKILPSSILQSHVIPLVHPLSSLLCCWQSQVAVHCATALNSILSDLSTKQDKEVWEILKERNAVGFLANNVKNFSNEDKPIEYFQEMAFLLSRILWRWPPSRFSVWTDSKLLDVLDNLILRPESSVKVAVLQLCSSLALCSYGAKKLLESRKSLVHVMVECMNNSYHHAVQMEGFKLAQCLMTFEQGCKEVMKICGKPLVNAIVYKMKIRHIESGKLSKNEMSLMLQVCRVALITRWSGDHQDWFWKAGVSTALLDLLLNNFGRIQQSLHCLSLEEQINILHKALGTNFLPSLRPYIWDILGGLAANCAEEVNPKMNGAEVELNILITYACLVFVESVRMACQVSQDGIFNTFGSESASRAVLMMVYSPCKYIAYQTRFILSDILKLNGQDYISHLLNLLNATSCRKNFGIPGNLQVVISLIGLVCYACLPYYGKCIIEQQGIRTILTFLRWLLSNPVCIKRSTLAAHLHNSFSDKTCCCPGAEDWDGEDMLLPFSLWALAELIYQPGSHADMFNDKVNFDESWLIEELKEICINHSSPGPRWFSAYILSHFGLYGFPSKIGKRIGKAFFENELTDLNLILTNNQFLHVHKVILMVRCPSLLPSEEQLLKEKSMSSSLLSQETERSPKSVTHVCLSAHVDHLSLLKLLEYVYLGYLQAGEDLLKKLKILAKHCNLQPLLHLLNRRKPRWGTLIPTFDLTSALGPAGHNSSDVLLESNTTQVLNWRCSICSALIPHLHVHKVILWSSCDYLRAMFHSGMQESISQTLKVPVSWNSLVKLVSWLYSHDLPKPIFSCLWDNLDINERLHELQPYIELCWLAEFWLLEDLHEHCFRVVVSGMETDKHLSVKVIQLAADFSQWKLAEIAATCMAPLYHQLRSSGDLDQLDESFIEMVRAASVQLARGE